MDRLRRIILVIMLALVLVSGLVIAGCSSSAPAEGIKVGKPAPDFQLQSLDGQAVSLSDFRGKGVLLNFWASWCGPCRYEMPFLQRVYEEWSDQGLVILSVNIGESQPKVKEFMESFNLSFLTLLDTSEEVALKYNIRAIPSTFFIDKDGIIQDLKVGAFSSEAQLVNRLSKITP